MGNLRSYVRNTGMGRVAKRFRAALVRRAKGEGGGEHMTRSEIYVVALTYPQLMHAFRLGLGDKVVEVMRGTRDVANLRRGMKRMEAKHV